MKYFIMTILLLTSLPCIATIYMQKNADGSVTYSDVPLKDAEPVSLSSGNSVPSTNMSKPPAKTAGAKPAEEYYKSFKIISPKDGETIQNQPAINVKVATDPEFRAGDTIQVFLDGQPWSDPVAGTSLDMTNVDRGTHTLYVKLLGSNRQTLKQTETITIYVHHVNTNFKPNR